MSGDKTNELPSLAVFISGGGTGLQSIIDATKAGILKAAVGLVVSSNSKAYGLERAGKAGISTFVYRLRDFDDDTKAASALMHQLNSHGIKYIALAGYLKLIPKEVVAAFAQRIINIHPGPLPKYGGRGMYGLRVHEAVLKAGEKETGPTVHLVDEIYDHGRILAHTTVPVLDDDTPETLSQRVLKEEHRLYPRVIQKLIKGEYEHDH